MVLAPQKALAVVVLLVGKAHLERSAPITVALPYISLGKPAMAVITLEALLDRLSDGTSRRIGPEAHPEREHGRIETNRFPLRGGSASQHRHANRNIIAALRTT